MKEDKILLIDPFCKNPKYESPNAKLGYTSAILEKEGYSSAMKDADQLIKAINARILSIYDISLLQFMYFVTPVGRLQARRKGIYIQEDWNSISDETLAKINVPELSVDFNNIIEMIRNHHNDNASVEEILNKGLEFHSSASYSAQRAANSEDEYDSDNYDLKEEQLGEIEADISECTEFDVDTLQIDELIMSRAKIIAASEGMDQS